MEFVLEAGELQPRHHVRCFHEPEMKDDAGDSGANRYQPDALLRLHSWRIGGDGGDQQRTLMKDAIMPQVMRQAERDARACCGEDRCRSG